MTEVAKSSFVRRDRLIEMEKWAQAHWAATHAFEKDAPKNVTDRKKFMATFPYPYMNGRIHVGHAFTLTKADIPTRFHQLKGEDAIFPFAFHCTGMPIQAAAGNLRRELLDDQPDEDAPVVETPDAATPEDLKAARQAAGVFKSSKSKSKSKSGALAQSEIMRGMGIPEEEIPLFTDPQHWLSYFPPHCRDDLRKFGLSADFRRGFITTDRNPYYDAFIKWQFRKLRAAGKVQFGNRPAVFSRREKQPCADHDRKTGEGVGHQEYTLIKLKVQKVPETWKAALESKGLRLPGSQPGSPKAASAGSSSTASVYFVAATLRPETMFGQTNCYVLPEGEYGLFRMNSGQVFVCSRRSADNMVWQGLGPRVPDAEGIEGADLLMTVTGRDLIGLPLSAPLSPYSTVYALPMLTISMGKGTGIVTSVPADSPDDFACLRDWQTKPALREQYGVKEEWCKVDVVPIITVPNLGLEGDQAAAAADYTPGAPVSACAPVLVSAFKIESHKDKQRLEDAKKIAYLKGFETGTLSVGPFAGMAVKEAKPLVRAMLIEAGQALGYFEPEGLVISRSGDECIVALCDQWYIPYGESAWTEQVVAHLKSQGFDMFNKSALNQQVNSVEWFKAWACSRSFGLGTRLPWDDKWIVESLSDSTIYMAYYTIAHLLQGDIYGSIAGSLGISAEEVTDSLFEYAFCLSDQLPTNLNLEQANALRAEFMYWYPVDLRVSGKDLIPNHLTMSLYIHAAIWPNNPEYWPKAFFCNGHVQIDGQKMSKSLGNFLTLKQTCDEYSADATRIALADAGDDLEDANFVRGTADKNILELWNVEQFVNDQLKGAKPLRSGELNFLDKAFDNEINKLVMEAEKCYSKMNFRGALKAAWFELKNLKDQYRTLVDGDMHATVFKRWVEVLVIVLSPIAPHFCEYMWHHTLGHTTTLCREGRWPVTETYNTDIGRRFEALQAALRSFRLEQQKWVGASKGTKPGEAVIFIAKEYPAYQQKVLTLLAEHVQIDPVTNEPVEGRGWIAGFKNLIAGDANGLKFATFHVQTEVKARGAAALELSLPYDEAELLREYESVLKRQLEVQSVRIVSSLEVIPEDNGKQLKREAALPGKPSVLFIKA